MLGSAGTPAAFGPSGEVPVQRIGYVSYQLRCCVPLSGGGVARICRFFADCQVKISDIRLIESPRLPGDGLLTMSLLLPEGDSSLPDSLLKQLEYLLANSRTENANAGPARPKVRSAHTPVQAQSSVWLGLQLERMPKEAMRP
ncbi:MAG: hypothetical protein SFZ03_12285 [Candidatus Melainabacteria bacterium]|nr:hypothetical protein [Candidatus Melainabacteria bacterium]